MSVHKLMQRIAAPDLSPDKFDKIQEGGDGLNKELNDFSHGIVHDPMALFAITFSALIHDKSTLSFCRLILLFYLILTGTLCEQTLTIEEFQTYSWARKIQTWPNITDTRVLPSRTR